MSTAYARGGRRMGSKTSDMLDTIAVCFTAVYLIRTSPGDDGGVAVWVLIEDDENAVSSCLGGGEGVAMMGTDDSRSESSWGVGQAGMEGRAGVDLLVLLVHVLATQKLPTRGWIFLRSATTPAPSPIRRIN
ncbi:hypothetical protein Purlil1_9837 [Purpureocillium lilacinum]|uniref:Uncharacterized protein n=1 Tax=Purpureocillium lilacinum TaxID=33203 RepID=A0ABR0BPD4_PURLI|nr:hypothetical protein Purlil1_9837 [Purpureocillium lilacinum]